MYTPHPRCKICKLIKGGDKELYKRIANSSYFNPNGKESLIAIQREYKAFFAPEIIYRHVRKHQTYDGTESIKRSTTAIDRIAKQEIAKSQPIKPVEVWDEVLELAKQEMAEGKIKLNAGHLLKAAKDKSDFEFKKKDQEMKLAEMIYHFASGEANESGAYDRKIIEGETVSDFDPAVITSRSLDTVENRPSDICEPPTGDASSLRASEVFKDGS